LFWCTEAVFLELEGVNSVISGYIGGKTIDPTTKKYVEAKQGMQKLLRSLLILKNFIWRTLEIFFATHDPTTINRQEMM
jgi:peptide-methionine (S)-S-oxide reductase